MLLESVPTESSNPIPSHITYSDGGDQAIIQCGSGEESGSLPAGESVPAWARCEGGSAAAAADSWTGGEEEER